MAEFPKKTTNAYVTSDGHAFENQTEAGNHEKMSKYKDAVLRAAIWGHVHTFGWSVKHTPHFTDSRYIQNLMECLIKEGFTLDQKG